MIPEPPQAASTLLRAASCFEVGHTASIGIVIVSVVIGATWGRTTPLSSGGRSLACGSESRYAAAVCCNG